VQLPNRTPSEFQWWSTQGMWTQFCADHELLCIDDISPRGGDRNVLKKYFLAADESEWRPWMRRPTASSSGWELACPFPGRLCQSWKKEKDDSHMKKYSETVRYC
jgi:hypothetical protein